MKRRRPTVLVPAAVALTAALVLVTGSTPARADAVASNSNSTATFDYRLTSSQNIPVPDPNATAPQVVASVPEGTIVPPTQPNGAQGSPVSILPTSTGFDQNQLVVALKDNVSSGSSPSNPAQQLLGLSFFGSGLQSKGQLDFALSVDKALETPPQLQSQTPGVTFSALQVSTPPPTTTTPAPTTNSTPPQVPEPMSVVLWSALAGAGLLWTRARELGRRRRRAA